MAATNWAELALLSALTDADAVEALAASGLSEECVPTPGLHQMYCWAIDAFMDSRRTQAPSRSALTAVWGRTLDGLGIELTDEDVQVDTVASAVKHLKAQYARRGVHEFLTDVANQQALAEEPDLPRLVAAASDRLAALAERVRDRPSALDAATGVAASLDRAAHRMEHPDERDSFGLGLGAVDAHTLGIQAGEIAIMIAMQKTGKSFAALWAALAYFRTGGHPALFTLENTAASAFDRLTCMANGVDYQAYQKGKITAGQLQQMRDWQSDNAKDLAERLTVLAPDGSGRTAAAMCRTARLCGADAVIIDQLSHMTRAGGTRYTADNDIQTEKIRELRAAVTVDDDPLRCLLLAQANRAAAALVAKTGSLGVNSGGGTSEIEKGPDHLYGLHRTEDDKETGHARLELLAFRRGPVADWRLTWRPWQGLIHADRPLNVQR